MRKILFILLCFSNSLLFSQELDKFNTIVIERAPHGDAYGISEAIGKAFKNKGFIVHSNMKYEQLEPKQRPTAIRCRFTYNIVVGGHSTLEIYLYDMYGNEIMNLYGDGTSFTAKGDMKRASRKALQPIYTMKYHFSPSLADNALPEKTLNT